MKKLLLFGVFMLVSIHVFGVIGWTGYRTILELEITPSNTEIRLEGSDGHCRSLTEGYVDKTWVMIRNTQENKEQLLSLVLVAFASGKKIDVYCNEAVDWPSVAHVRVQNAQ